MSLPTIMTPRVRQYLDLDKDLDILAGEELDDATDRLERLYWTLSPEEKATLDMIAGQKLVKKAIL